MLFQKVILGTTGLEHMVSKLEASSSLVAIFLNWEGKSSKQVLLPCSSKQGFWTFSSIVLESLASLFSSRVMTYREHTAWVVKAYLQKHPEGNIMSVR